MTAVALSIDTEAELDLAREHIRALERALGRKQREVDLIQEELSRSNDFLREVHRVLPDALLILDGLGSVFSANEEALRLLGATRDEVLGRPLGDFQTEVEITQDERHALLVERRVLRRERIWRSLDGVHIPVLVSMATAGTGDELSRMTICIAADLRDRQRMEMEIRQRQKLEAVGQLAAGVAHEINTPIQYVGDSIHFLREAFEDLGRVARAFRASLGPLQAGELTPEAFVAELDGLWRDADLDFVFEHAPPAIARAIDGVSRVAEIVGAMREFSHPGHRTHAVVNLNRTIVNTLTVARNEYKYVADVETDLGDLPDIVCHGGEIGQVLLNLIINAGHAMADVFQQSQQRGRLTVRTRREGDAITVEVSDTGGGIAPAIRERIYEPFFTTKPVGRGTGQGLAIARAIIERHGGTIDFDSEVGVGTTFRLRLPTSTEASRGHTGTGREDHPT
ncbi:ATP-binding protein [Myxococcota bacterium]|nr:ATP-binding protein [Myxococcota bacterium]